MVELQRLCDKVPSYSSVIAFQTIEDELGKKVHELFSEITPEPVAAASLGQVYKAKLRTTGETVAVKVCEVCPCYHIVCLYCIFKISFRFLTEHIMTDPTPKGLGNSFFGFVFGT